MDIDNCSPDGLAPTPFPSPEGPDTSPFPKFMHPTRAMQMLCATDVEAPAYHSESSRDASRANNGVETNRTVHQLVARIRQDPQLRQLLREAQDDDSSAQELKSRLHLLAPSAEGINDLIKRLREVLARQEDIEASNHNRRILKGPQMSGIRRKKKKAKRSAKEMMQLAEGFEKAMNLNGKKKEGNPVALNPGKCKDAEVDGMPV